MTPSPQGQPMPPVPPAIADQQQAPPLRQFAQSGGGMQGAQQAVQATPSMQLVEQTMDQVAHGLESVAKIINQERPELLPLLKPVVQGLAMFMSQVKVGSGAAPQGGVDGTAAAATQAPDAPGPAAMGM